MDWQYLKKKNPLLFANPLNPFPYLHKYVRDPLCLRRQTGFRARVYARTFMFVRSARPPNIRPVASWAICHMRGGDSRLTRLALEWWPELAASLINLMDSELTRDEFIRWLHFTLLIFMLIGKAGRGQGQVEAARTRRTEWLVPYYHSKYSRMICGIAHEPWLAVREVDRHLQRLLTWILK